MSFKVSTDYGTYQKIRLNLHCPISGEGIEPSMLKNLYQSKLLYLEELRIQCFLNVNSRKNDSFYSQEDYVFILSALRITRYHMREFIINNLQDVMGNLER